MPNPAPHRRYWLFKSEPDVYGIEELEHDRETTWEGVRNYQARNLLRDEVRMGDGVLFYHSNAKPLGIAGIARVVRAGYPDDSAWNPRSDYFDADSDRTAPTWFRVDVAFVARFSPALSRETLLAEPSLAKMMLLQKGSRLSIQPVTDAEWRAVLRLARCQVTW